MYGDYPPASPHTVETVYCGGEWEGLLRALRQWPFYGGTPVRNALHEGVAAAILAIRRLRPTDESSPSSLVIIGTTLYYEDFQTNAQVRAVPEMAGQMMEAMLTEVKDSGRIRLSCYFSSPETAQTFSSILGRIYGVEELRSVEKIPTGWTGKTTESKTSSSIRSSSGESINFDEGNVTLDAVESTTNSALEGAVRQFLTAVLKLPHNQRADAIKRHLESPAYSAEYKQSLVSMVRQMQNVAKSARKTQPPSTAIGTNGPPPQRLAPSPSLATVRTLAVPPIWRGRVAFRANADTFFDVAAIPIPNPKSMSPQTTPMASE